MIVSLMLVFIDAVVPSQPLPAADGVQVQPFNWQLVRVIAPVIVSLNPVREPHPDTVIREFTYSHPIFDQAAVQAQRALPSMQGVRNTWFAGAWTGYGFHEDGLKSGLEAAAKLTAIAALSSSEPALAA